MGPLSAACRAPDTRTALIRSYGWSAILVGGLLPPFVLLLVMPDRNSGVIGVPLLVWLGAGVIIGMVFVVFGLRVLSFPGTLLYRITRGRIFTR